MLFLVALVLLVGLALGCEQLQESEGVADATLTPPSAPEKPKGAVESGEKPSTPKPAATPAPASTPLSVMTPLAVLPSYTPEPTATTSPRPTSTPVSSEGAKAQRAEYITRCKHWALRNLKPIEYSRFEELDPYNMTDLERVLWAGVLVGQDSVTTAERYFQNDGDYGSGKIEWCQDYWSEPLSERNAEKRNTESDRIFCTLTLVRQAQEFEGYAKQAFPSYGDSMASVVVNQPMRILNWMDIDGMALLNMEERPSELVRGLRQRADERYRVSNSADNQYWPAKSASSEVKEWWKIEESLDYDQLRTCKSYYPQLFFGRWVPLDSYGSEELLEEAQEKLSEARERDEWPDWAETRDRDILIRSSVPYGGVREDCIETDHRVILIIDE